MSLDIANSYIYALQFPKTVSNDKETYMRYLGIYWIRTLIYEASIN